MGYRNFLASRTDVQTRTTVAAVKVAVVAEFYPSDRDPVLGMWSHKQAVAARDAGAEVEVLVLHRLVPPQASLRTKTWRREMRDRLREPRRQERDGIAITYLPYISPPRSRSYARWGAWAAPSLALALRRVGKVDLIHAHNAVPAADAVRRTRTRTPLVVSVHGGDVLFTAGRAPGGEKAVRAGLGAARLVLANSAGIAGLARDHGASQTRVVHLGTDIPPAQSAPIDVRSVVTVGHLVARKRHADVIRALATLDDVRYTVIGDGPEMPALEQLAEDMCVDAQFWGQLPHHQALAVARGCAVFAMPSVDEAFGVAYVEAMAAGLPAVGAEGEPGPAEIGDGLLRVPPGDVEALSRTLRDLLDHPQYRREIGEHARRTVLERFTWERCGRETVAAYEEALR
jgi:teichuronic acid biosynthesis glycosyltransferase TuaC